MPTDGEPIAMDADAWIGRVLDARYRVNAVLGSGGFGHVFRAKHLILGRDVAIKVLQATGDADPTLKARFEREATALATVSHPNVVAVSDYGVVDGCPYLVMELVDGIDLRKVIDAGPLAPERAVGLTVQILRALGYAHERGIVHRDLKPGNVMVQSLGAEDHVKLLDFGFAKFFADAPSGMAQTLTAEGVAFGTPGYVAPEQLSSAPVDGRADLYAAGVILFEMIDGVRPFKGDHPLEELRATLRETPPRLTDRRPELAGDPVVVAVDAVVARAMERDPGNRFASAGEMLAALAPLVGLRASAPAPAKPSASPPPAAAAAEAARRPAPAPTSPKLARLLVPGALVVALLGALSWWWATRSTTGVPDDDTPNDVADPLPAPPIEGDVLLGPPVAGRPPPRNPWDAEAPPELAPLRDKVEGGTPLAASEARALQRRGREVPDDARSYLLLGHSAVLLRAPFAAVHAYDRAFTVDASCRGDVRMLRDLLGLVLDRRAGEPAAALVVRVYGTEALPAVDRALAALGAEPEAKARFEALRARLSGGG